ncbi:hypothetical protein [Streptomyces sp. NBC_00158]|uniref:hypothetical protein n=1 Tax=Streptomyces sp. NBC_00158 TaxID=2903627 RepID=UPI00324D38BF
MPDTSQGEPTAPASEAPIARATATLAPDAAQAAAAAVTVAAPSAVTVATASASASAEGRGCLFALSQPPLMIFLAVVGTLLLLAALHDLYLL